MASWNLQKKISDLKFTVPEHVKPIRDKVLNFVQQHIYPLEKIKDINILMKSIKKLQQKAKDEDLWALGHPKTIGGQGMPFRDYIYVNEIQGRSEISQIVLGTSTLQDSLMLYNHASHQIKNKYLNGIVQGTIQPSFAMTEPYIVSSDPTGIKTYAKLSTDGKHWIINGEKWFTSGARTATFTTIMLRTEFDPNTPIHESFSMILVPTNTPGYNIIRDTPVLGTRYSHGFLTHAHVKYDNIIVPYENLVGQRGKGFLIAQERLGPGRIFHCMRWLGQMQRAYDLMCKRLVERKVRGGKKLLGDLQLMQKHVFDSYCDISAHRLMTMFAAEKMDSGDYARVELAACKAWGAQALCRVLDRAVQVFGAKGLTDDTPLGQMYRHGRAARFYDGPDEVHMATVGRLMTREYKKGNRYDFSAGTFIKSKL
eukprot:244286_1